VPQTLLKAPDQNKTKHNCHLHGNRGHKRDQDKTEGPQRSTLTSGHVIKSGSGSLILPLQERGNRKNMKQQRRKEKKQPPPSDLKKLRGRERLSRLRGKNEFKTEKKMTTKSSLTTGDRSGARVTHSTRGCTPSGGEKKARTRKLPLDLDQYPKKKNSRLGVTPKPDC